MSSRVLGILAVIAALVAILAIWLSSSREAETGRGDGADLFPALHGHLNDIERVQVSKSGEPGATLVRTAQGWVVSNRSDYPADVSDLRRVMIAMEKSQILEAKTANPESYERLGVSDPDSDGARSTLVEVTLPDSSIGLIVGDRASRGQTATYVRRPGEAESWLASGDLGLSADPASWLAKDVIDVPAREVRQAVISHPGGERIELVKSSPDDPSFLLANLPEGRDLLSAGAGNTIASALSSLRLEDVVPAAEFSPEGEPVTGRFETFDGIVIDTRAWQQGEDRYVALEVSYEPPPAAPAANDTEDAQGEGVPVADEPATDEAAAAADDSAPADEQAAQADDAAALAVPENTAEAESPEPEVDPAEKAQQMQARVAGWVYKVPSYKYANLTKDLESLLKPLEES